MGLEEMKHDLKGVRIGRLVVAKKSEEKLYKEEAWDCVCDCGNSTKATTGQLLRGAKKSCGCLRKKTPPNTLDLAGKRFGKLTVIERAGATKAGTALWLCACDCGGTTKANATSLRRGDTVTCGCGRAEQGRAVREKLLNEHTVDGVQVPLLTRKTRSDSSTGHKGVYKRVRNGKESFEVNITVKGKRYYAGPFSNIVDAITARKELEKTYHAPYIDELKKKE